MTAAARTRWIVEKSKEQGFDLCGVAPTEAFEELARLPEWLARGYAGEMRYLHDPRRASADRARAGARSVIVCALNYNTPLPYSTENAADQASTGDAPRGWISRYAWGDDYHEVLEKKLDALLAALREEFAQPFDARVHVDTGPILERVAAKHAGLGWLGKNTCLIHPELGSWLFLGVIVTTLELEPSLGPAELPQPDLCGQCRLCIDACPTGAIVEPYVLDARRCISYLTIELRDSIPAELREPMGRMVFGCDICQDVCPWNRSAPATSVETFHPRRSKSAGENQDSRSETRSESAAGSKVPDEPGRALEPSLFAPELEWLASLTEEQFREGFRGSAMKRAKWRGLVRNACVALGNSGVQPGTTAYSQTVTRLKQLADSPEVLIAEHARWALRRLTQASDSETRVT